MNEEQVRRMNYANALNNLPYLDDEIKNIQGQTLGEYFEHGNSAISGRSEYQVAKSAVDQYPELQGMELVHHSEYAPPATEIASGAGTDTLLDDPIQASVYRDADGNYYVVYRGTGEGRWVDNAEGMYTTSEMQKAAAEYFDKVVEDIILKDPNRGKIIVTGHSKGANEAQYVTLDSRYEYLIDECYAYDGQGFANKEIERFRSKHGDEYYDRQLDKINLICGEDDYVHPLGTIIAKEENTYYFPTGPLQKEGDFGEYFTSLHHISYLGGHYDAKEGKWIFVGLHPEFNEETGEYEHGHEGPIAQYIREVWPELAKLNDEDLEGTTKAVMFLIDLAFQKKKGIEYYTLSGSPTLGDFFDLLDDGLPVLINSLIATEEGRDILLSLIKGGIDMIMEKYGLPGVLGLGVVLFILAAPLIKIGGVYVNIITVLMGVIKILDTIFDAAEKLMEIWNNIKKFGMQLIENVSNAVGSLITASEGFILNVNTVLLRSYASRIRIVNKTLQRVDDRLGGLRKEFGADDYGKIIKADILTSGSYRLSKSVNYLDKAAEEFENAEARIKKAALVEG